MNKLPSITQDFSGWYNEVIYKAELVDHSPVRGTMIIRPYGYAIWELIVAYLDIRIKETGHQNASFPLFIPESFLKKEATHVAGFSPELAFVTHAGGQLLEEPLVVRPTSETIIHYMFARWIKSWRDLPLKVNQWANVIRWEMRARPFLRTTEFFWQEGHTAHATYQEAIDEVLLMLQEYVNLSTNLLAIPVITGKKTEHEKFPGAEITYTFEGLMQDGKALQMGTSHLLSQSFAKAFEMQFQNQEGNLEYPFLTSWAITTRLIGASIMVHGDDKGLILPPYIAPIQLVIIPIYKKDQTTDEISAAVKNLEKQLKIEKIRVYVDDQAEKSPGAKYYHWEMRGVPFRVEIGARDLAQGTAILVDRLTGIKQTISLETLAAQIPVLLQDFHKKLLERATEKRNSMWYQAEKLVDFGPLLDEKPGFYQTGWCARLECEQKLKEYKASTRCLLDEHKHATCFNCDNISKQDVLIAKSY